MASPLRWPGAFKTKQALDYAALKKARRIEPSEGIVYFFDTPKNVRDAFEALKAKLKPNPNDHGIFMGAFDADGNLVWIH